MKFRTSLAIAAVTVTGLVVGIASPASADDTTTTFSLTGGDLTMSVAVGPAALTSGPSTVDSKIISGQLGAVSVTDARGGTTGWVVSAASTTFTNPGLSVSEGVSYTVTTEGFTKSGVATTTAPGTAVAISTTAVAVMTATAVSGNNSVGWNPTLDVTMPAGALAGAYSGVVTTSIV